MNKKDEVNVFIIGDISIGKTALLIRWIDGTYTEDEGILTIGEDFKIKKITIDRTEVTVKVWDTAGQEAYKGVTSSSYRRAEGVMVCYDSTTAKSFESLPEWLNTIEHYGQKGAHKILIATKTDLTAERRVDFRSATEFSKDQQMEIFETSSKTNQGVNEAFMALVKAVWEKKSKKDDATRAASVGTLDLKPQPPKKEKEKGICDLL